MFVMFPALLGLAAALCLPGWSYARRRQGASSLLLFMAMPATIIWVLLSGAGIGAQSLSNLIEVLVLLSLGVAACYLQVFFLDRHLSRPPRTSAWLAGALVLVGLPLRLMMPVLPE